MERFFLDIVVRNLFNLFPELDNFSSKLDVGDDGAVWDFVQLSLLSNELKDWVRIGSTIWWCWRGELVDSDDDIDKKETLEGDDKPWEHINWCASKSKCSVNLDIL